MNIGQAAKISGISAKMIRYYESIGLVTPAGRSGGNYRTYAERDIQALCFVRRARSFGFPTDQIRDLLALGRDTGRTSAQVKAIAERHLRDLDARIGELVAMRDTLQDLAARCAGDDRPECPILDGIGDGRRQAGAAPARG
jgi:Cu(I)-responsive transcriptional regulator